MEEDDISYFRRRAAAQRRMAGAAHEDNVRLVHTQLADLYDGRSGDPGFDRVIVEPEDA